MNIFFLHILPALCALYHCDKHVVKMIIETAQILSAAHWLTPDNPHTPPYRLVRNPNNKPMNWARETIGNYRWLVELGLKLCEEYTHRYGKVHASQKILEWMRDNEPALPNLPMTTFPPAIPDGYIVKDEEGEFDTVESYRKYYVFDKRYFAKWTKRDVPEWYTEGVANLTADEIAKTDQAAADYKQKNADRRKRKQEREAKAKAEADANKENKKNEESDADEDERPAKKVKKTIKPSAPKKTKKKIIIETDEEDEEAEGSGDEYTLKRKLVMTTVTLANVTSSTATSSTATSSTATSSTTTMASAVRAYPLRERRLVYSRAVKVM